MSDPTAQPSRPEVEKQLATILLSDLFISTPKLSLLLRRLIADSFHPGPINDHEYELGIALFNKPRVWVPSEEAVVRQTLVNLRKNLAKYYTGPGSNDLVIIDFPKGFRPRYSYNAKATVAEKCRHISETFYHDFPSISPLYITKMLMIVKANPSFALAHAHLAEMLLVDSVCGRGVFDDPVKWAEEEIAICIALNDRLCFAHLISGAIQCCRFEWEKAEKAFQAALELDTAQTRSSFWYMAFLMATYRSREAFECLEGCKKRKDLDIDTGIWTISAAFLYLTGDIDKAYNVVLESHLAAVDSVRNWEAYRAGMEAARCENWLVDVLMACIMLERGPRHACAVYAIAAEYHHAPRKFKGLICLGLACSGVLEPGLMPQDGGKIAQEIENEPKAHGPFCRAVAGMATGIYFWSEKRYRESDDAFAFSIEQLEEACNQGNPIMAWLHLLPPFKGHLHLLDRFNRLLDRVAPPRD
jgi:tetratricopeptide (TPR) repeat protein